MKLRTSKCRSVDASPKMTLADMAERYKVDADWLRQFVGRLGIKPVASYANPTRRYYSMTEVRDALRAHRKGLPN